MIITAFKGYLGNQMFQYAAARKFAHDGETELKLDINAYNRYGLDLRDFNITENLASKEDISKLNSKGIMYYLEKLFLPRNKRSFVWEKYWEFDHDLIGIKRKNMYVRGVFQSEKYFEGIENILRKEFTLKNSQDEKFHEIVKRISDENSVSVHMRRNDFLLPEQQAVYSQCNLNYYNKALGIIAQRVNPLNIFVFSDGIEWVKENVKFPFPTEYVSGQGFTAPQELILMSNCRHNITANSTFSWWAVWLNNNPKKIVIAPKDWLVDKDKNEKYTRHLIPKSWIQI